MDNSSTPSKAVVKKAFSQAFHSIWAFIKGQKHFLLSFSLPCLIMLAVYAIIGIFPFGQRSILTLDMNAQYIYYFEQLRDVLLGNGSLIYTWERVLGGEFLGFFTYYVASPFALLLVLFPPKLMVEAITVMMILKCGISGLSFAIYLDKTGRKRNMFSYAMFSTMYALCAYAMAYQSNTMWMDALMWLPLLTLGIEKLVTDGRFKLFTIMLAIIIWSNYYIGYMVCIYTLIYFVCFICAHKTSDINNLGEKKHLLKSLARIAVCSLVALLMVAMIILCAYYSISFGKAGSTDTSFTFDLRFDFLDLISKFFIGSYDTVRPAGLPNVYCGILALFMLPIYFLAKKISPREKISYGVLALVFVASMSINAIDLVWHGFQMPVWMNYRYSFMLSFIILIMAYKGFELFAEFEYKSILQIGSVLLLLLFVIQKIVLLPRFDGGKEAPTMPDYELIWISLVFVIVYMVVLYYKKRESVKKIGTYVLFGVVCLESCVSAVINWAEEVNDVGWAKRDSYRDFIDSVEPTVDYILEKDTSFYRMEKTLFRKPNENFALDIRGLSASTSTYNKSVMNLMDLCGFNARSHWSKYFEGNELVDSIFGIKYVISNDEVPVSSIYIPSEGKNSLTIYENPYALSIAYCVDSSMKTLPMDIEGASSPMNYLELLASNMVGTPNLSFYNTCFYSYFERENCSKNGEAYIRSDSNRKASFTYSVTAYNQGSIYMHLDPSNTPDEAVYYINGVEAGKVLKDESERIHNIGNYNAGDTVYVKVEFDCDRVVLETDYPFFVQLDEQQFKSTFEKLNAGEMNITKYSDTRFCGSIVAEENQIVMTTIPYDKYWNVYVDDERVETYKVLDSLLAFDIDAGTHKIELKYSSRVFNIGVIISLFGLALFVVMCVFEKKYRCFKGFDKAEPVEDLEKISENIERDENL